MAGSDLEISKLKVQNSKPTNKKINIGVFDSGVGGRLIADKLKELKNVKIVYLSDPEYFPYGDKTGEIIQSRLLYFAGQFKLKGCRIVVLACNTATTNGIAVIRQKFPGITFIGIEPPIKPISNLTKSKKIAIMGTPATIASQRMAKLQSLFVQGIKLYNISCPGLAEYIEERVKENIKCYITFYNDKKAESLIKRFLDKPIADGVDVVGIACTHYPYLLPIMQNLYPKVKFYDPANAVAAQVKKAIIAS
ncbi:aspartate/glutamate racemase family protein [Candidatus Collierbacteria bacterium]|nr:aspartate/glutamate racemase family protein [Candidatus Collierbacteria bacterium]